MDSQTLESIVEMICGDGQEYPVYRSGSELTRFFRRVGFSNFIHDGSTRKWWTPSVLEQLTDNNLKAVILDSQTQENTEGIQMMFKKP